jgi:hypothetical protein
VTAASVELRVARVADVFDQQQQRAHRFSASDFVVVDHEDDVLAGPFAFRDVAERELEDLELRMGLDEPDEAPPRHREPDENRAYEAHKQALLDGVIA